MAFFSKSEKIKVKKRPPCSAVIAAAGSSQRMCGEDKLFMHLSGVPVLAHTLIAYQNCAYIDEIIVVTQENNLVLVSELCGQYDIGKATKIMVGGTTRIESVMNGLLAVSKKARLIAIQDGARPCVSDEIISSAVAAAAKFHAAAPGVAVSSTIKRVKDGIIQETVDRENLFEVQTPQVFDADLIKAALKNAAKKAIAITDDCMAAELIGVPVHITEGSVSNIKITTNDDIAIAEAIIGNRKKYER